MSTPPFTTDNEDTDNESVPEAVVTVGEVEVTDELALYTDMDDGVWVDYEAKNSYEGDSHRYMLGISSPGGFQGSSVAFVQTENPTLLWVCEWTAARWSVSPDIPDPDAVDTNWVLLDVIPVAHMETVGPDGVTPLYRISGTYVYGHKNPAANVFDDVAYPRPPWLDDTPDRSVNKSTLKGDLVDKKGGGGSAPPGYPGQPGGSAQPPA